MESVTVLRTDSAQCPHSDLDINFHLTTMVDSNVGLLHLWARCKICDQRMNFGRGLSMGASSLGNTHCQTFKPPWAKTIY